jgi:protein-disulfide isomerase
MLKRILAAATILPAAAFALDLNALSGPERDALRQEIRAYLMDNPQVILEAVSLLEQQQERAKAEADFELVRQNAEAIFTDGFSYVGGNPDGDVTLVEFIDYRCGYCKKAFQEVEHLLKTDGNIRFIIKEFPILGEQSLLAAQFAIATRHVAGDEAYKAVHDGLMALRGEVNAVSLQRLARGLDLDFEAIESAMQSPAVEAEIAKTRALAQALRISGTPTFVLHDEMLRGYLPLDAMQAMVAGKR